MSDRPKRKKRKIAPDVLRDMRKVFNQPPEMDRGVRQQNLRILLRENIKEFVARMTALESSHRTAAIREAEKKIETEATGEVVRQDEGETRALEVAQRWLQEHGTGATCS